MKKKVVSLVLATTMVLSMSTTVFAEEITKEAETAIVEEAVTTTEDTADATANEEAAEELALSDDEQLVERKASDKEATGTVDLSSISISNRNCNAGDTITIHLKTTNVKRLHFYYKYTKADGSEGSFMTVSYKCSLGDAVYDESTGYWTLTVNLPSNAAKGVMVLEDIQMIDNNEKYSYVWNKDLSDVEDSANLTPYYIGIGGASLPNSAARNVPHCTLNEAAGEKWDGTYYTVNGQVQKDVFFCDGTYTYYLQANGTPMKDRLTYHPDGEHVIYFDESGHEVFDNFQNVKRSITGEAVDDICYFDTFGHMYVDRTTYDKAGVNLYYINPYGVLQRGGWFTYPDGQVGYADENGVLR